MEAKRVGVVGYGKLGQFLVEQILSDPTLELAFVWNRTPQVLEGKVAENYIITDLKNCASYTPDIIVEVAHPCISKEYGTFFLEVSIELILYYSFAMLNST